MWQGSKCEECLVLYTKNKDCDQLRFKMQMLSSPRHFCHLRWHAVSWSIIQHHE